MLHEHEELSKSLRQTFSKDVDELARQRQAEVRRLEAELRNQRSELHKDSSILDETAKKADESVEKYLGEVGSPAKMKKASNVVPEVSSLDSSLDSSDE